LKVDFIETMARVVAKKRKAVVVRKSQQSKVAQKRKSPAKKKSTNGKKKTASKRQAKKVTKKVTKKTKVAKPAKSNKKGFLALPQVVPNANFVDPNWVPAYTKRYADNVLRPFDVQVAYQMASGKGQGAAWDEASMIASRDFKKKRTRLNASPEEKKELDRKAKKGYERWASKLPARGYTPKKLVEKVKALKKKGNSYNKIKDAMGVSTNR